MTVAGATDEAGHSNRRIHDQCIGLAVELFPANHYRNTAADFTVKTRFGLLGKMFQNQAGDRQSGRRITGLLTLGDATGKDETVIHTY